MLWRLSVKGGKFVKGAKMREEGGKAKEEKGRFSVMVVIIVQGRGCLDLARKGVVKCCLVVIS